MNTSNETTPEKDDIWQDLDPRSKGRQIKVIEIGDGHAIVKTHSVLSKATNMPASKIRLDRFRASKGKDGKVGKKGYILISRASTAQVQQHVNGAVAEHQDVA